MYRIGQTKPVKVSSAEFVFLAIILDPPSRPQVFQLVAKDTIEDKVLEIQERKQTLISQAFSGTKGGTETAKQRKQARLEDLRELFA